MKKTLLLGCILAGGLMFTACQNDEGSVPAATTPEGMARVKFSVGSQEGFQAATRAAYQTGDLRILKFKQNSNGEFIYNGDVPTTTMTVNNEVISGGVDLPFGIYKFVSTYGLNQGSSYSWSPLTDAELTDDLAISYTGAALPEIFMDQLELSGLPTHTINYSNPEPYVISSTLKRAVGRVDMMFIRADKMGEGQYTDMGTPAFGNNTLGRVEIDFDGLNNSVNLVGGAAAGASTITKNYTGTSFITGTGTATAVGEADYQGYSSIAPADLNVGTMYMVGDFVFPNYSDDASVTMTVDLIEDTDAAGNHPRTLEFEDLPIERNKVTLVKVYILNDDPFLAPVEFEVTLVNDYDAPIIINKELQ